MSAAVLYCIGGLKTALAPSTEYMVAFRIVLGLAVGCSTTIVPLYLSELAPKESRGALSSLNQLMITIGILLSLIFYAFSDAGAWRWMLGLALIPSIGLLIGIFFMPESPRWLLTKGKEEKARRVLSKMRGGEQVDQEVKEIKEAEKQDQGLERAAGTVGAPGVNRRGRTGISAAIYWNQHDYLLCPKNVYECRI